jgi:hexosaminidase
MRNYLPILILLTLSVPATAQPDAQAAQPDAQAARSDAQAARYPIIPYPARLRPAAGYFTIGRHTFLRDQAGERFRGERALLGRLLDPYLGSDPSSVAGRGNNEIIVEEDPAIRPEEGYRLSITPQRIVLAARDAAGMFYAVQTLRQLMPASAETGEGDHVDVPCAEISDHPAFAWRGLMLDVSRHFFSTTYLKKCIDLMSLYKLNKLHLHLTDDQGWRIEIKKYPRLTQESAWRTFNGNDSTCIDKAVITGNTDFLPDPQHIVQKGDSTLYGGYYTQDQMRDVIRYAASRHVEVIPEIDMPGHMMAAVKLYPELTCDTVVGTIHNEFSNPICPCNDRVLAFAKDIFSEIADVFPSRYIHIGGDEVNTRGWAKSPVVSAFMKQKGFTRLSQVQNYFNDVMVAYFHSRGKTLVGWDEIIDGGIDTSAVAMFWRSWAPKLPAKAAARGNKVVMSADGPLYFDGFPDETTLSEVYHYDPLDTGLYHFTPKEEKQIIGVQANLWSERIPSEKRADYMLMPRLTALSEIGWTHVYSYASYLQRLDRQYDRLDRLQVNYRLPDLAGLVDNYAVIGATPFFAPSPSARFTVRYTLDGSLPEAASPAMVKPVVVDHPLVMKLALFTAAGRRGDVYTLHFNSQQYSGTQHPAELRPGLTAELYNRGFPLAAAISGRPDSVFTTAAVAVPKTVTAPAFGLRFKGYLEVPQTGIYTFYLKANDGGVLYLGGQKIIDNDGFHPDRTKGGQAGLEKGLHPLEVDFMEGGGGYTLDLRYSFQNSKPAPVPASWFKTAP